MSVLHMKCNYLSKLALCGESEFSGVDYWTGLQDWENYQLTHFNVLIDTFSSFSKQLNKCQNKDKK